MAIYSLTFFGFMPVGALWIGTEAEHLGEPTAVVINSVVMAAFSVLIWVFLPRLRRVS
jgi:hypothetical protein